MANRTARASAKLRKSQDGQSVVELSLIIVGIALVVAVAIAAFSPVISNFFSNLLKNY